MTKWLMALAASLCVTLWSQAAEAGSIRLIYNEGEVDQLVLTVADGSGDDDDPEVGVISFNIATFGGFTDVEIDAETKDHIGSATSPEMYLETSARSSGAGTLQVQFSEQGFGPSGTDLQASLFGGSTDDVDYVVWFDDFNSIFGTTTPMIALSGSGFIDTDGFDTLPNGNAVYSLTQGVVFTHGANGGESSGIARLSVDGKNVPDGGSTAALLGAALMAVGAVRRRFGKR